MATSSLRSNINDQMKPRTAKFKMIDIAAQTALRVQGSATSLLVMGRAHCEGSTALHFSARSGNAKLIRWLLDNGANPLCLSRTKWAAFRSIWREYLVLMLWSRDFSERP